MCYVDKYIEDTSIANNMLVSFYIYYDIIRLKIYKIIRVKHNVKEYLNNMEIEFKTVEHELLYKTEEVDRNIERYYRC